MYIDIHYLQSVVVGGPTFTQLPCTLISHSISNVSRENSNNLIVIQAYHISKESLESQDSNLSLQYLLLSTLLAVVHFSASLCIPLRLNLRVILFLIQLLSYRVPVQRKLCGIAITQLYQKHYEHLFSRNISSDSAVLQ